MRTLLLVGLLLASGTISAADGNRLTYLDGADPYYVSRTFPKLITPQWVGDEGVEAVVILAIDDMRMNSVAKYEAFLRPILNRLQKVEGTSAVSIMTCQADPKEEQLQKWLKEGVSLDAHTWDHPCPLLQGNDFAKAAGTYHKCVDALFSVRGNGPVAFRTPCCDSQNTPSPRTYAEIFNRKSEQGRFLRIDSSVMNIFTANDPALPRDLVLENGQEHFRKYNLPGFYNTIEDYPYPYVINKLCWQFPCVMPSDWQAQRYHKENSSPHMLRDWQAALDATVIKQGVYCLIFHPHGWCKPEQIIDLIDHAVTKHGKKVKFMTFKEAHERLTKNLLGGQALRDDEGGDNGVRLLDVNNDGFIDVLIGNNWVTRTRIWSPKEKKWLTGDFPMSLVRPGIPACERFGLLHPDGFPTFFTGDFVGGVGAWHFDGRRWVKDDALLKGLEIDNQPVHTANVGADHGVRLRDLDGDGQSELIVANPEQQAVFSWSNDAKKWTLLPFSLPNATIVDDKGRDNGLRFVDVDEDGHDDIIVSNEKRYSLDLFTSMKKGWSREVMAGKRGTANDLRELPAIARAGTDNGVWFHSRGMCIQNETVQKFARLTFNDMLSQVEPEAKSPKASLRSLRPRPGFQVELMAAEPLVQDPIAFAWGPDGKLWVVEMGDYPLGADGKGKGEGGGRVKYLEDTKGTGKYDKATVFLDNLPFPTSVLPWRNGVLVTCAPEIFYAEDTKGAGKADRRVPLFTGFGEGNQQHRVNSLAWGLDNWIYCANGDSDGIVKSAKSGTTVDIRGRDFRIRPDDGALDLQTGRTQYGRSRDDWNHWFGNNNSNPMWHAVLADHYVRRNAVVAATAVREHLSVSPGAAIVFPISRTLPRFNNPHSANHFTSACSSIVYRDDLFGPHFSNSTFVSEPVHNLVHREVISAKGCTFSSQRAIDEQESEFLASSDNWFRPTSIQTGPDGALWIADMYRAVIEHPQWIPADWQKKLDLRAGHNLGRIYRVYPVGTQPRAIPRLDRLDTAGLVAALDSPSGWQRDTAQQMLLWKADPAAVPLLINLAEKCERPLGRAHALGTLDGLGALTPEIVRRALADPHPGVREQAVRLAEGLLAKSPALGDELLKLTNDPSPFVRLQLACTLGEWKNPKSGRGLAELLTRNADDGYIVAAVLSSINATNLEETLRVVMSHSKMGPAAPAIIESLLKVASAPEHAKTLATLLTMVATPEQGKHTVWQYRALAGWLDFLDQRNTPLVKMRDRASAEDKPALQRLETVFASARLLAASEKAPREEQLAALRVLGRGFDHQADDRKLLATLLTPQTASEVQATAIAALGQCADADVPERLIRGWKGYTPAQRGLVLDVLFRRIEWTKATLSALERRDILPSDFDAPRRQMLLQHKQPPIREQAAKVFAGAVNPNRQKVVDAYQGVLKLSGDAKRGSEVFAKNCSACHRLGNTGHAVGPDLASVGDKSVQGLLVAVLDPNRVVEARYVSYTAVTKNGLNFNGLLASETGNSITLLGPESKQQVILRADLDDFYSSGQSVMPEGVEKEIPPQAMADLIAFVRSAVPSTPPPK